MASSNRHWPSMFKSKPCSQWQHDHLIASACHRSPYTSAGCEERSPEPKPRWNPRPEQIRILEAIFNSGMVNPPRDEIRKIRGQLQEYGQVGDANVFYWFQNRKSRSKHKLRHKHHNKPTDNNKPPATNTSLVGDDNYQLLLNPQPVGAASTPGFMVGPLHHDHQQEQQQQSAGLFFGDITKMKDVPGDDNNNNNNKSLLPPVTILDDHVLSPIDIPQLLQGNDNNGSEEAGSMVGKSTVIINDVAFEVPVGPFNVREAFGDDAVLINSYGQPVLTDQWGLTLHSLTHGAFYYLI